MDQIINDIISWMNAGSVSEDALRDYLRNKGFAEDDIDYILGQLTDNGFSVINHIVTYRGLNYRATLPPNRP